VATGGVSTGGVAVAGVVATTGIAEPEPPPQAVTLAAAIVPIHHENDLSFNGVSYVSSASISRSLIENRVGLPLHLPSTEG
jgi:hypothetical protein